jgi:predicted acetyltransferase
MTANGTGGGAALGFTGAVDLELRPIVDEEYPAWSRTIERAFGAQPSAQEIEDWRLVFERNRSLAVFDGPEIVATTGAVSFDLTLPGGTVTPVAGVTAVAVRTTHRRRGLLRALMERQLDDVSARGEALAILTASESVIYGRFGYGPASSNAWCRMETAGTELRRRPDPGGRLRQVEADEAGRAIPAVYDRARTRHPGALSRSPRYWQRWFLDREPWRQGASARFYVLHHDVDGTPDGYLAYRAKDGDWGHGLADGTVIVEELDAVHDEVEAALWQYVLDIDLVRHVRAEARPVDEPLRWRLADPRRLQTSAVFDHLWVRLLDVPAALSARRYAVDATLVVDVRDPFRPAGEGRYVVEGGPEGAGCRPTDREPDLTIGVAELGSLYLGGVSATTLARAGRVEARTPAVLRVADAFFTSTPAPWCCTPF